MNWKFSCLYLSSQYIKMKAVFEVQYDVDENRIYMTYYIKIIIFFWLQINVSFYVYRNDDDDDEEGCIL